MKTVSQIECSFLAVLTADMHLLGLPSRREPEGLRTAAQRGKTLHKAAFIHGGHCMGIQHGSLTAGNKGTVCERISKEMPSQPVVPGQEHTAVSHTAPQSRRRFLLCCCMMLHTHKHLTNSTRSVTAQPGKSCQYSAVSSSITCKANKWEKLC